MRRLRDRSYGDHWDLSVPFTAEADAEMMPLADVFDAFSGDGPAAAQGRRLRAPHGMTVRFS